MRRILLVLSAAALVAAITAFSSVSAVAQEGTVCDDPVQPGPGGTGDFTVTCYETEVVTEEVREPATEDCVVDNPGRGTSGRPGTQEGEEVRTDQVTYKTTITKVYQGYPEPDDSNLQSTTPSAPVEESRVEGESTFEPTGPCQPIHGPAQPK